MRGAEHTINLTLRLNLYWAMDFLSSVRLLGSSLASLLSDFEVTFHCYSFKY